MEKTYNPKYIEQKWSQDWEHEGYFQPQGAGPSTELRTGKPYCIVIPPPNVTGTLHMGHGFQHTLMDVLTRYHRMCGDNTLWQVGTDHAGISTQMVVTKQLIAQGKYPKEMGREKFLEYVWDWKEKSSGWIQQQMRRTGISVDWSRERFTMDEGLSQAVQKVFIDLHDEGLIYRGKKLVNWDPVLNTAISDLEVINEEHDGFLWYIRYPLEDKSGFVTVATTRPETMLGDAAVAVNPDDERFKSLIGKYALLPLTERKIPIIADDYVDKEFGTGCVKITPAHDFNDYAVGQRHDLPLINILTPQANINDNAPSVYRGMDRFEARKQIIKDLQEAELLVKTEKHKTNIPKGDRTDAVIEPYLTDQWFVKVGPLAKPAIEAVESGKIKFIPENWSKTYLQWLYNIEDWCISRQLWWGHRIPAWYDADGKVYVGADETEVRQKHKLADDILLTQDDDVLDTWFSSSLWPFSTLGWPEQTPELKTFYPTNVLVTGFDIIFFWVVRMVMMGIKFTGEVPFHEVYITGLIRDNEGHKMSKSKGNVLDPIDLVDGISLEDLITKRTQNLMQPALQQKIAKDTRKEFPDGIKSHGMDALRFTFCALATTGRDINFDLNRLDGYRNFCNKIWNATRFVLMNNTAKPQQLTLADRWILSKLQHTIAAITEAISNYRFDILAQVLYEFIWHEYCDWYLELCKAQDNISITIIEVLEMWLRLLHPLMPFITEDIWQQVAPLVGIKAKTIMLQPYPKYNKDLVDSAADTEVKWLKQFIIGIRNIRGEMNIAPNKPLPILLRNGSTNAKKYVENNHHYITKLAKVAEIKWVKTDEKLPATATALVEDLEIHIPLADIIDKAAEQQRLNKEIAKLKQEIERSENKLNNKNYVEKAPEAIVATEKQRLAESIAAMEKLQQQLTIIAG